MNAVVSGHSGVAMLIEGDACSSIHFGQEEVQPRRPSDFRLLFNGARDLQFLEDVELEEVRKRLDQESTRIDVLHLALILLDRELSDDTRRTAAEELEELLADDANLQWLESVLYARPLPRSGDLVGARSACTGHTRRTRAMLGRLQLLQAVIAEVHSAWERIPTHLFGTDDDRQHVLSVVVKEGLFRDLVALRADGRPVDDLIAQKTSLGALADARQALREWGAGFDAPYEVAFGPNTVSYVAEARVEYAALEHSKEERLRAALDELPPQLRRAFMLRVREDLKYREIAEIMHVPIETVKAHLSQARQQLQEKLADYFDEDPDNDS